MLIQVNGVAGYSSPTLNIVNKLRVLDIKTIVYVGPGGASASAYGAYLAMASTVLVMNAGTSIGTARIAAENSAEINSLMSLMRQLAASRGRNADAAERMVIDNRLYSAEEAYSEGVCDLVTDSYGALLAKLGLDPADVIESVPSQDSGIDRDSHALLMLLADPSTIKWLYFAATTMVCLNLVLVMLRPLRARRDETYQSLLDLIRVEAQSSAFLDSRRDAGPLYETPLHTPTNMWSDSSSKLSRIPTVGQARRMEKPLEVNVR